MSDNHVEPRSQVESEKSDPSPEAKMQSGQIVARREPQAGTFRLAMRLALGSIILGREELNSRFRDKQAQLNRTISSQAMIQADESGNDRARYAVEGALVHTSEAVSHGIRAAGIATNAAFKLATRLARPVTGSRLMGPVRRQFDRFEARGEELMQTWIDTGRSEEYLSRTLVQDTSTEIIEEVLDYLAVSPEMDQLVEQQTSDLTEDMVEELQEKTTRVFVFRNWFRRSSPRR